MSVFYLLSGGFLGWGLGANDSANVFGTAVYTKVVSYRLAVILTSIFVIVGASVDGHRGLYKVSDFAQINGIYHLYPAFLVMLAAGITVLMMTRLKLPVSTSQAVIGSVLGHGIFFQQTDLSVTTQFLSAWVLTPVGGLLFSLVLYFISARFIEKKLSSFQYFERTIKIGYLVAGVFAAYSLGANNVANVFGVFMVENAIIDVRQAAVLGGIAIASGVLTYSRPVMMTVGEGIVPLSNVTGFIVVIAAAITVYIYAVIGIPVSTSQAVVGALIGIGLIKDYRMIEYKMLLRIFIGWLLTPALSALISYCFLFVLI